VTAVRLVMAGLLALALHLGVFAAVGARLPPVGVTAAGDQGAALIRLAPVDPVLSALVAEWDRPPPLPTPPPAPPVSPLPLAAPPRPAITAPPPDAPAVLALPDLGPDPAPTIDAPPPAPVDPPTAKRTPPARPQPAVAAQTAQGSGGTAAAGTGGQASAATSDTGAAEAKAEWGAAIRARIERRKAYPGDAGGATGRVSLRLVVGSDGRLISVVVLKTSGHAVLDRAAITAVKAVGRFPKAPRGLGQTSFTLPVSFAP
jgi:protein TonB